MGEQIAAKAFMLPGFFVFATHSSSFTQEWIHETLNYNTIPNLFIKQDLWQHSFDISINSSLTVCSVSSLPIFCANRSVKGSITLVLLYSSQTHTSHSESTGAMPKTRQDNKPGRLMHNARAQPVPATACKFYNVICTLCYINYIVLVYVVRLASISVTMKRDKKNFHQDHLRIL